jgi:hypothetical protein
MPSEICQAQKEKHCMISLHDLSKNINQIHRNRVDW